LSGLQVTVSDLIVRRHAVVFFINCSGGARKQQYVGIPFDFVKNAGPQIIAKSMTTRKHSVYSLTREELIQVCAGDLVKHGFKEFGVAVETAIMCHTQVAPKGESVHGQSEPSHSFYCFLTMS
jgi:hypothetical protein